jgi:hypothetical protein
MLNQVQFHHLNLFNLICLLFSSFKADNNLFSREYAFVSVNDFTPFFDVNGKNYAMRETMHYYKEKNDHYNVRKAISAYECVDL